MEVFKTVILFGIIFIVSIAHATPLLKGYAAITLRQGTKQFIFNQSIVIDSFEKARFEAGDDFGNTLFAFTLGVSPKKDNQIIQKKLKLPLTKNELLEILLYAYNPDNKNLMPLFRGARLIGFDKKKKDKTILQIRYDGLKIMILSPKTNLSLKWIKVERTLRGENQ